LIILQYNPIAKLYSLFFNLTLNFQLKQAKKSPETLKGQSTITVFFFALNPVLYRRCTTYRNLPFWFWSLFLNALQVGFIEAFGECFLVYRRLYMGLTSTSIGNNESFLSHFGHFPLFCEIISSGGLSSLPSYKT